MSIDDLITQVIENYLVVSETNIIILFILSIIYLCKNVIDYSNLTVLEKLLLKKSKKFMSVVSRIILISMLYASEILLLFIINEGIGGENIILKLSLLFILSFFFFFFYISLLYLSFIGLIKFKSKEIVLYIYVKGEKWVIREKLNDGTILLGTVNNEMMKVNSKYLEEKRIYQNLKTDITLKNDLNRLWNRISYICQITLIIISVLFVIFFFIFIFTIINGFYIIFLFLLFWLIALWVVNLIIEDENEQNINNLKEFHK